MNAQRVIADLRELAARTSTPDGAQRLAWGPVWRKAREWFAGKIAELRMRTERLPGCAGEESLDEGLVHDGNGRRAFAIARSKRAAGHERDAERPKVAVADRAKAGDDE